MENKFDLKAGEWDNNNLRVDRALNVASAIKKQIKINKKMKAMEFGSGTGLLGFNLIEDVAYLTFIDTSKEMLEQVNMKLANNRIKNAGTLNCDLSNESLNEKYDLIFSLMALHHIANYKEILKKLTSALNPSGFICISDLDKEDGSFHGAEENVPYFGFERDDIVKTLKNNGIKNIKVSTVYVNKKVVNNKLKEFPVFLIAGQKNTDE